MGVHRVAAGFRDGLAADFEGNAFGGTIVGAPVFQVLCEGGEVRMHEVIWIGEARGFAVDGAGNPWQFRTGALIADEVFGAVV